MNWKKYSFWALVIALILLLGIGVGLYYWSQRKIYIAPPRPLLNWQHQQFSKEPETALNPQRKAPKNNKKTQLSEKKIMDISLCEDNPNTPDYVARQLKATGRDETPCARVKLNLDF